MTKAATPDPPLAKRVVVGSTWLVGAVWAARLVGVASVIVLARLIMPEDFGLIAVAAAYAGMIEGLTLINVGHALIAMRRPRSTAYDTAFTLGAFRGLLLSVVMLATAPLVANVMDEPRLILVIGALSIKPVLRGLGNPKLVDLERRLAFSRHALLQVVPPLFSALLTIAIALVYRTYWALVVGSVAKSVIELLLNYLLASYRPRFSLADARYILNFAGWLTGASVLRTLSNRIDSLLIGGSLGTAVAGIYYMGNELNSMLQATVGAPINRSLYSALALTADEPQRLLSRTLDAVSVLAMIVVPMGVGLALVAPELVAVLLGEQWALAALVVQWLAPVTALKIVSGLADNVAMCKRQTRHIFRRDLLISAFGVSLLVLATIFFGFAEIIVARVVAGAMLTAANLYLICSLLSVPIHRVLAVFSRTAVATVFLVTCVLLTGTKLAWMPDVTLLAAKIFIGAAVYIVVHAVLWTMVGRPPGPEGRVLSTAKYFLDGVGGRRRLLT